MKKNAHFLMTGLLLLQGTFAFAQEVLPSLSDESLSAYKNAFGKAIADSNAAQAGAGNVGPAKTATQLRTVTTRLRDSLDQNVSKGPGAGAHLGPKGLGPPGAATPGGNGGAFPPPGMGGPGQPGGPPPPSAPPHGPPPSPGH